MNKNRTVLVSALGLFLLAGTAGAQQVKISQVYGGGGNTTAPFNRDFVELFNAGATPVDISGWSVQYASATGTTWAKTDLTGATIPAGGYYLVQMTLTGTTGAVLPTPDHVVATAISMSATAGKVALVNNTTALTGGCPTGTQIIDFVGFGTTANCFEGSGPTGAPSNSTAALRNDNGCQDNGDNAANFSIGEPNPRNSAVAAAPCPLPPGADLGVSVTDGLAQLDLGQSTTFIVTVANFGPDASSNATVTIPVPANTTFISSSPANAPVGGVLTFSTGAIPAAGTTQISVTLRADSGTSASLTASASGVLTDPVTNNNQATDSTLIYSRARARVVAGADNAAVNVSAFDVDSGASEVLFTDNVRALASDDADRVFYYSRGTELWKVSYDAPRTPALVGAFNGAVTTISGGMAFDSSRRKLVVSTTSSFYEVNTTTARTTLLRAVGSGDFGGMDYDAATDRMVCTNDSTSTTNGLSGRGLYRIDPFGSDIGFIASYPIKTGSTVDTDIDACAFGGGRIYPVSDENLWFYRFDEASALYIDPFPTGFGADRTQGGATYTEALFNPPAGPNLSTSVAFGQADCSTSTGDQLSYTVTVTNVGVDAAGGATITTAVPAGTTFVSSSPSLTPAGGVLTLDAGSISPGGVATLQVTVQSTAPGAISAQGEASISSGPADPLLGNNTASASIRVRDASAPTIVGEGVFSTFAGSNEVPGLAGVRFSDVLDLGRPFASRRGGRWIMNADTDVADTLQDQVLLRGSGLSFEVVAQEGVTALPNGFTVRTFDVVSGVNEAGDFAFGTDYEGTSTLAGELTAKNVGGVISIVAEQNFNSAIGGATYGSAMSSACITDNGQASFYSTLSGAAATQDSALFGADGSAVRAQEGVTIPTGQIDVAAYNEFSSGTTLGQGSFVSADGTRDCVRATLEGATATDTVVTVNNAVVLQEGAVIPGSAFISPITTIAMNYMEPNGVWTSYGSNSDNQDWAVVNGAVVATRDEDITPANPSGVSWAEAGFAQTFFLTTSNGLGDYVVGGLTSAVDTTANAMLVLNGRRVVLRENDAIDLNRNGVFDDDAYVHIFRDDFAFLTADGWLYVAIRTRNGSAACTGAAPAESGQALIRVRAYCAADYNRDGVTDPDDLSDYISCFFDTPPCAKADQNGDGFIDPDDLSDYIALFFGGGC